MNDLRNNEIRVTVSAMAVGEQYESVDAVAEYGDSIPLERRVEDVVAITSMAAAGVLRDSGIPHHMAANILRFVLDNAYAKEDDDA